MKDFIWSILTFCTAIVLCIIMIGLIRGVSEHFEGFFRGALGWIVAHWIVSKVREDK